MPAYAGFKDLRDYIDKRCAARQMSLNEIATDLKWPRAYIYSIYYNDSRPVDKRDSKSYRGHRPSRPRADALARYFGDPPRLVRVLSGLEAAPSLIEERDVAEIVDMVTPLSSHQRRKLIEFINFLRSKK